MKKFLSMFVAVAMILSLFAGIAAPTAKAAPADGIKIIDTTGTKLISADDDITQDYYSTNPTLTTEGTLATLPDGDYVYNMGDIITGKLTLGGVDTVPASPWRVSLVQFPNTVIDFTVVSAGVGTFTIGTANVRYDGPYFLRIESLAGVAEFAPFDWFNNIDAAGAANLYIKYNVAWVLDTITPCPQLQHISGYVTRGNGQTVDVPVFVGVSYPITADPLNLGTIASYYSISRLSSGQFAMTFLGRANPGLYRVFIMDGYYDTANLPGVVDPLNYSHGVIAPWGGVASNFVLDHDAMIYKTISTIPTAFAMKAALFTNPVYLYQQQIGQRIVISLTDAFGKPVTGADWYVENTSGVVISSTAAPNASYLGSEIDAGYYKFDLDTSLYTGTDLRFYFKSTLYGEDFTSNKIVVDLRIKGAWNPYLQVGWDELDVSRYCYLGRTVYDNLPCTIGSGIWLKVGYWTPVPADEYYVYDETVTFTGPLSYMAGTRGTDLDGNSYYKSGEWYHFRITKAGAIGASVDTTMWQRQDLDTAYDNDWPDASNACCKTFTKTFTVCEIKSCTTTSVQLSGGAQTDASNITVGGKADIVVSVDPTGAPADLFCGCNSKIVRIYLMNGCNPVEDAFTVDTYGGGTAVTLDELWYNGIPESLATYGATATCPAPTGYSADGSVLFQQTTPSIIAVDNCTTLTFKGVTFNFPTGWTTCGTYRLVVEVFGEQRGYDQCGVLCPTFPFISESVNPISVNPVTVSKTSTATIYEAGYDPSQILAGVAATVEITKPGFSGETSSKWEAPANWSFSFKAAGDDTFHTFDYWGLNYPTVSSIDTGYRFSSFCMKAAGTIQIYNYSYNTDNDCKQLEELYLEIPVVMPTFDVKIELLDGTMLDSDGILTAGFGETVHVTATDPRTDVTHDFSTDSTWHLDAYGRSDSCGLLTSEVCLSSLTGCIGCAGGNALTITGYDNPCLEGAGTVRLAMVTTCGYLKVANFTLADPTVTVDPTTVAFTIPASATHVTFTVKDAHGHGAPGVTVNIAGIYPSTGASGYSWSAGSVETGKDPMGEADWAFVPPFSGQYKVTAGSADYCDDIPEVWTGKYAALGATITAKYQAPVVDTTAPVVTVTAGIDGSTVAAEVFALTGKVTDNVGVSQLYVGFNKVDVLPDGSFMTNVKLAQGENTISVVAYDAAGNKGTAAVKVTYKPAIETKIVLILTIGADIVSVNGKATSIDAAPEIVASRTFVPIRFIAESFGATVEWLSETQGITITLGDHTIGLQIGNATAVIDGSIVSLSAAPYIKNGRTMVPLRVISEAFGGDVVWDPSARTITITYVP